MGFVKRNAAAVTIGALVIVGGSYAGAKALTAPQTVTLDSATSPAASPSADQPHGLIRGEGVIAKRDGTFPTVQFNRGVLSKVDGTTLVISEADGKIVNLPTDDKTRFRRDGQRATLSDLRPGDHVGTLGTEVNGTYVTKMARAFSPDAWSKHESERQARRRL